MSNSSPILESFIHANYPGMSLPPLWQVIYQEAVRGHHLLFQRVDVERFEQESGELWQDTDITDDLETVVLRLVACSELRDMVRIIDGLALERRRDLYTMYKRVLWMWKNYIKDQMN